MKAGVYPSVGVRPRRSAPEREAEAAAAATAARRRVAAAAEEAAFVHRKAAEARWLMAKRVDEARRDEDAWRASQEAAWRNSVKVRRAADAARRRWPRQRPLGASPRRDGGRRTPPFRGGPTTITRGRPPRRMVWWGTAPESVLTVGQATTGGSGLMPRRRATTRKVGPGRGGRGTYRAASPVRRFVPRRRWASPRGRCRQPTSSTAIPRPWVMLVNSAASAAALMASLPPGRRRLPAENARPCGYLGGGAGVDLGLVGGASGGRPRGQWLSAEFLGPLWPEVDAARAPRGGTSGSLGAWVSGSDPIYRGEIGVGRDRSKRFEKSSFSNLIRPNDWIRT